MRDMTPEDPAGLAAVDNALRTYPQATPPPTLAPAVLARIQTMVYRPPFRLAWIDYALSLFMTGMFAWLLWPVLTGRPSTPLVVIRDELMVTINNQANPLLLAGLVLAVALLLVAAALFERR